MIIIIIIVVILISIIITLRLINGRTSTSASTRSSSPSWSNSVTFTRFFLNSRKKIMQFVRKVFVCWCLPTKTFWHFGPPKLPLLSPYCPWFSQMTLGEVAWLDKSFGIWEKVVPLEERMHDVRRGCVTCGGVSFNFAEIKSYVLIEMWNWLLDHCGSRASPLSL